MALSQNKRELIDSLLARPAGALCRPTETIPAEDSLGLAAQRLRANGSSVLPVVDGDRLIGVVTQKSLLATFGAGASPRDSVVAAIAPASRIAPYQTAAEALRAMEFAPEGALVVVDDHERVVGLLAVVDLVSPKRQPIVPTAIGGMATPFGVYLTTGSVSAGAGPLALMASGASLGAMMFIGALGSTLILNESARFGLASSTADYLAVPIALIFFFVLMRLSPLSGIHGAEHKVVHAIERGEELTLETVRRMPRVHPRCGTNIAAGLFIFANLFAAPTFAWIATEIRLPLSALFTFFLWRPVGSFAQRWITTRPPSDKQLDAGIRSGKALLEKVAHSRVTKPNPLVSLGRSGIFHVALGSSLAFALIKGFLVLIHQGDLLP